MLIIASLSPFTHFLRLPRYILVRLCPLRERVASDVIHKVDHPDVRLCSLDPNRADSQSPHRVRHERKEMFNPRSNRRLPPITLFLLLCQWMTTMPFLMDAIACLPLLQHGIHLLALIGTISKDLMMRITLVHQLRQYLGVIYAGVRHFVISDDLADLFNLHMVLVLEVARLSLLRPTSIGILLILPWRQTSTKAALR